MNTQEKIYLRARSLVGTDASPRNNAPNELACAESVSSIIHFVVPGFPVVLSTSDLNALFEKYSNWNEVPASDAGPGDIIIAPTGTGGMNGITHGHTEIISENGRLMGNQSFGPHQGKWMEDMTIEEFFDYFKTKGGYDIHIYRRNL